MAFGAAFGAGRFAAVGVVFGLAAGFFFLDAAALAGFDFGGLGFFFVEAAFFLGAAGFFFAAFFLLPAISRPHSVRGTACQPQPDLR